MTTELKDLIAGTSNAVAAKVAEHAAKKAAAAPKKGKSKKAPKGKSPRAKLTAATKARDSKEPRPSAPKKVTIASAMREAIMKGLDNSGVFAAARKALGSDVVTDDKRWFAAWYRADMKRKGMKGVPASKPSKVAA